MIGKLVDNRTNEEYELTASPTPVGRHQANALRLRGFAISRFHAEIGELEPGRPYIEDVGSTYGTYVNGKKVEGRVELHDDDQIVLGVSSGFPNGEYSFTFKTAGAEVEPGRNTIKLEAPAKLIRPGTFQIDDAPSAYVARLSGVFRRQECDAFADEMMNLVRAEPRHVVVELSDTEYMNSYALGILVKLSQDVEDRGHKVVLAGAQGLILKLFQTVGLDQKLGSYPTEHEALAALAAAG